MHKSRFTKSKLFRCLVMFSVLATILLLYNIVNISFARRRKDSNPSAGFNLTPEKYHELVDIKKPPSIQDNLPPKKEIDDLGKEPLNQFSHEDNEDENLKDLPVDEDPHKLIIVTEHDPDPGHEIQAQLINKEDIEEPETNPEEPDNPDENEDEDGLPPAEASQELGDLDIERVQLLKESSIFLQKEAISKLFSTMNLGAGTDNDDDTPENILSSMQMSEGGKPIRNLIFATWSSGSTFVGDVVKSHPLSFYHFEPLMAKENVQIRPADENASLDALNTLKALLNCDYSQVGGDIINYFKKHSSVHEKNPGLWEYCEKVNDLCLDREYLSGMCKLFPYQVGKLVRLRLKLAESLLADEDLNLRVLHLVRDPRGILCSRRIHHSPCGEGPVCQDPKILCSDMVDDYHAATELREKYPDKFLALRYEDISLAPQHGFEVLLHHFRLQLQPEVQAFLDSHTIKSDSYAGPVAGNSFLNTKTTPFQWIDFFKQGPQALEDLGEIEKVCREAMDLWGYASLTTTSTTTYADPTSKEFNPVLEPPWSEMRLI